MITIFDKLGMLTKIGNGNYKITSMASERIVFQYGDVMTIKKWYSLAYYVIQRVMTIGKEEYVKMMIVVYKRFVKIQDYLHKNIHRIQVIYKLFYGGFIQAV